MAVKTNTEIRKVPEVRSLGKHALGLAKIVADKSYLPDPDTVQQFKTAVFPSIRNAKLRTEVHEVEGQKLLMDDNFMPRWALLWSHGIKDTGHPKGWLFAHVWPSVKDPGAFTHLANLIMIPESFASLTDKDGPLTTFLRHHAWSVYGWKPQGITGEPERPDGFKKIRWNYLPKIQSPEDFVRGRVATLDNRRVKGLRSLMGISKES